MKDVMLSHVIKYPLMQPADVVKLLYQSEFAGGHLIQSPSESLMRLIIECRSLKPGSTDEAFEPIGGGLCRLYLSATAALDLKAQTLNRLFVATANSVKGTAECFHEKLELFLDCCRSGKLAFDSEQAAAYVQEYRKQGCPPVSHSDAYREAYAPAYRVVKSAYCHYIDVFRRIDELLDEKASVTVVIEGNSGAGKSTLAALLAEAYDCNVFHTDDFFLPQERKTSERLSEPGGNVDYERLRDEVAQGLKSCGLFTYRRYNCQTAMLSEPVPVPPKRLNVLEGVYSLHPALNLSCDLSVFLKTDHKTQLERIRARSGDALSKRFKDEWIPLENRYFNELGIEQKCDLIYDLNFSLDENIMACI